MTTNNNSPKTTTVSGDTDINTIMKDIEKKTEKKVDELLNPVSNTDPLTKIAFIQSQKDNFGDKLVSIMNEGANDFKERTGRNMTYSEMRSMYG